MKGSPEIRRAASYENRVPTLSGTHGQNTCETTSSLRDNLCFEVVLTMQTVGKRVGQGLEGELCRLSVDSIYVRSPVAEGANFYNMARGGAHSRDCTGRYVPRQQVRRLPTRKENLHPIQVQDYSRDISKEARYGE